nr:MAB_1171c family putative transporter [Streptomyces roseifaciens]
MAYFVDLEIFRRQISGFLGFPNATTIIVQASVVVLTAAQQVTVVNLTLPPEIAKRSTQWQVAGFGAALTALIFLFFAIQPKKEASAQETVYLNIQNVDYAAYMAYYLAICAAGRFQTVLFSFRYARTVREFWLRLGMWFVAAGSTLILAYCAVRYWQIIALHAEGVVGPWKFLFWSIADAGTLLQIFGWTAPSWGPKLNSAGRWLNTYRDYLRLAPLWRAVYQAAPNLVLEPPASRLLGWIPRRQLDYHLYRRVIEIRDAQLVLRHRADPIAIHRLEQAHGMQHEAMCEAAVLRSALYGPGELEPAQEEPLARRRTAGVNLAQEIALLAQVSKSFQKLNSRSRSHFEGNRQRAVSS